MTIRFYVRTTQDDRIEVVEFIDRSGLPVPGTRWVWGDGDIKRDLPVWEFSQFETGAKE